MIDFYLFSHLSLNNY